MPYNDIVLKKPYYDAERFGEYVRYKSIERRKKVRRFIHRFFAVFDICVILSLIILSVVLVFNSLSYVKGGFKLNTYETRIIELDKKLSVILDKNQNRMEEIRSSLDLEDIKMKAIFNLDMVSPTEKSTITFDVLD